MKLSVSLWAVFTITISKISQNQFVFAVASEPSLKVVDAEANEDSVGVSESQQFFVTIEELASSINNYVVFLTISCFSYQSKFKTIAPLQLKFNLTYKCAQHILYLFVPLVIIISCMMGKLYYYQ